MERSSYESLVDYIFDFCYRNGVKPDEVSSLMNNCKVDVLVKLLDKSSDIYVVKTNGNVQRFDEDKLYTSIANASDEIDKPLTSGDLHSIVKDIVKRVKEKKNNLIYSNDIRKLTLNTLKDLGFQDVYNAYRDFVNGDNT